MQRIAVRKDHDVDGVGNPDRHNGPGPVAATPAGKLLRVCSRRGPGCLGRVAHVAWVS